MTSCGQPASRDRIVSDLRALGVRRGGVLLVHTSFRAAGPVEGGPRGLVDALRSAVGASGTLVMPSWGGDDGTPFDPSETPAAADLGVVADVFWRLPCAWRSDHPHAFAAAGPLAPRITADPLPMPPHAPASPVGRVLEHDGRVLLLGVGHDANTMLHLAELLGRVPYRVERHVTVLRDGRPTALACPENDHCCERFALADGWLRARGAQAEGTVGRAPARLARAADVVGVALEHLARDPLVFLHEPGARCAECDAARASVDRPPAAVAADGP